jgi:hypothetical protein
VSCAPYGLPFSDQVSGEETLRIDTFFEAAGAVRTVVVHDRYVETDRNSISGKILPFTGNRVETFDLMAGTRTVVGKSNLMTDPGVGIVIHDTGRVVFDAPFHVSFASGGRHDVLYGDIDELTCKALVG